MFTIHTHQWPYYLTNSVHPYSNNDPARYRLRSLTGTNYSVPRTRTKFGDRAFSVARPVVWNSLPVAVHHADSLHSFKCKLRSHFFSLCFNDWQCNALQVQFRTWRAVNSLYYFYLFYLAKVCAVWDCEQFPQVLTMLYCIDALYHCLYCISDLFATFVLLSRVIS